MSELAEIKRDIADTKAKLKKAEAKLECFEEAEDQNEMKIQQCREDVRDLRAILTEQQKKENILLINTGK